MKMKMKLFTAALCFAAATGMANAQNIDSNWFIQGQLGASYSVGNAGLGKLISPAGAISVGKYFNPDLGLRLSFSGWNGKGGYGSNSPAYSFNYGAATVDGLFNLNNIFFANDNTRPFNLVGILGVGFNHAFDGGAKAKGAIDAFMARAGLQANFRLNDAFDFNIEANVNGTSDRWNRQDDHSFDTYVNVLAGVTYRFGTGFKVKCATCDEPQQQKNNCDEEIKRLNNKINELRSEIDNHKCPEPAPAPAPVAEEKTPGIKSHVIFKLAKTNVEADQQMNINAIADYMKQYPNSKATVTGYADVQTGTSAINERLAAERARIVADQLINHFGISASRLTVDSKGSDVQPFSTNDWNRVVIMIAQ